MATAVNIRPVRSEDAEGIVRVLNPIIESGKHTVLDKTFTADEEREFIAAFPERGVFLVAESRKDGAIVGFQSLEPFAAYTHAFDHVAVLGTFVDLSLRRHGIGTCLSEITFEAAQGKGYEKIFTYVRADNPASLAFHERLGFRIVGTAQRQARLGITYVDEIVIEKFL
jgi:L-amino acid N-acyltransferase YncA